MNNQLNNSINSVESIASSVTSKIGYTTAASTGLLGWIGSNQFAVVTGFLISLAMFLLTWYYKRQEDKRREERHKLALREAEARIRHLNATSGFTPLDEAIDTVL